MNPIDQKAIDFLRAACEDLKTSYQKQALEGPLNLEGDEVRRELATKYSVIEDIETTLEVAISTIEGHDDE